MGSLIKSIPSFATGYAMSAGESKHPERWKGLIAAYAPFLGKTADKLYDFSGFGNHGTLINMDPSADWVFGKDNWAIDFNGTSQHIDCGNKTALDAPNNATLELLVKWPTSFGSAWDGILGKRDTFGDEQANYALNFNGAGGTDVFQLYYNTDGVNFRTLTAGLSANFSVDIWYLVHGVYRKNGSSTDMEIWVNGRLVASVTTADNIAAGTDNLFLGATADNSEPGATQIGMVNIYKRALFPSEIKDHNANPYAMFEVERSNIGFVAVGGATPKNITDSAVGSESESLSSQIGISESGVGSDGLLVEAGVGSSDTGSGSESVSAKKVFDVSDSGTGVETLSVAVQIELLDSGSGTESLVVAVTVSATDAATGAEVLSVTTPVQISDTGLGTEELLLNAQIPVSENALGLELVGVLAVLTLTESGLGVEQLVIFTDATLVLIAPRNVFTLDTRRREFILDTRRRTLIA